MGFIASDLFFTRSGWFINSKPLSSNRERLVFSVQWFGSYSLLKSAAQLARHSQGPQLVSLTEHRAPEVQLSQDAALFLCLAQSSVSVSPCLQMLLLLLRSSALPFPNPQSYFSWNHWPKQGPEEVSLSKSVTHATACSGESVGTRERALGRLESRWLSSLEFVF